MRTMGAYVSLYDQLRQRGCSDEEATEAVDWSMCWDHLEDRLGREPRPEEVTRYYKRLFEEGETKNEVDRV